MTSNESVLTAALVQTLRNLKPISKWAGIALALLYTTSGIQTIQPGETGLELRFGKLQQTTHSPGLVFAAPPPFATIVRIPTGSEHTIQLDAWAPSGKKIADPDEIYQPSSAELEAYMAEHGGVAPPIRKVSAAGRTTLDPVSDGYALTADSNIIQGRFTLRYKIVDPKKFYRIKYPNTDLLTGLLYQAATATVARHRIDDSLTTERALVGEEIYKRANQLATRFDTGVQITACEIRELSPPRQTVTAFEDVVNAQLAARTLIESSHSYANRSRAEAEARARTIRLQADAHADELLAQARGESQAFLSFHGEYKKNPTLIANRLYLETLDSVMDASNSAALFSGAQTNPTLFIEPAPEF